MSRLSLALINQLTETLRQLQIDFNEIKNRQPTSGKSGVLGYTSQTDNEWDKSGTLTSPAPNMGLSIGFEITYTADGSQPYPIVNPFADLQFRSASHPTWETMEYNEVGWLQWTDGNGNSATANAYLTENEGFEGNQLVYQWRIYVGYFGSLEYRLKAFTRGSSRGSITVEIVT